LNKASGTKEESKMITVKQGYKAAEKPILSSPSTFDGSNIEVNKSLERYYKYILELVRMQVPRSIVPPEELDEEINDLAETTLIIFWSRLISGQVQITSPKAYIRYIVRSQCVDLFRQLKRKPTLSLPTDQDGELYQGKVLLIPSDGMQDPALEFEHEELIAEVIDDVLRLPHHQQYAMICLLKDEVGDTFPLVEEFAKHGIDIRTIGWPLDPDELHKLKSSLSAARKKLRSFKCRNAAA